MAFFTNSSKDKSRSFEDKSTSWDYVLFTFLNPLFEKGSKEPLEASDLGTVSDQDNVHLLYLKFMEVWSVEKKKPNEKRSLWGVLWRTIGYKKLFYAISLYGFYSASAFGPIEILNKLVKDFAGVESLSLWRKWLYVSLIFVLPMAGSIFAAHSNVICAHIGLQFRNSLIAMIYRKSLLLSPAARQVASTGQIVNMFSNDTAQIQIFLNQFFNTVVLAPATVAICLYLIYVQVGVSTFVGLGMMVISFPFNGVVFGALMKVRRQKSIITDARVKLMNEILSGIRVIKFYAWENAFMQKVLNVRAQELVKLRQMAYIITVFFTLIMQGMPVFMPVLVFYTYIRLDNELDAATAFTVVSLYNLMQVPFMLLPVGIAQYSQSLVACRRMMDFFDADELAPYVSKEEKPGEIVVSMTNANLGWILNEHVGRGDATRIKIDDIGSSDKPADATATTAPVSPTTTKEGKADYAAVATVESPEGKGVELTAVEGEGLVNRSVKTLHDISFQIKKGQLVAVVGSVGCGKSSLLSALLGEMHCVSGEVQMAGTVAYCDQRAWILNDTVEGNILFGSPYDEEKFDRVMFAANLEDDVKTLQGGLKTQIGERGINLSGGQKARVALARAIYRDADVYLLDDPLSAVDAHVGQFLFHECIRTTLKGKTRILVTHQVHLLPYCDLVIVLEDGKIRASGTYEELKRGGVDIETLIPQGKQPENEGDAVAADENQPKDVHHVVEPAMPSIPEDDSVKVTANPVATATQHDNTVIIQESVASNVSTGSATSKGRTRTASDLAEETQSRRMLQEKSKSDAAARKLDVRESTITTKENRKYGAVPVETYMYYIRAGGIYFFAWAVLFMVSAQLFTLLGSFWLQDWGEANTDAMKDGTVLSTGRQVYYLNVYAAYASASIGAFMIRSIILANHRLGTSALLNEDMLRTTLNANVAFFDTTPVGRILNRFSSDLLTVDEELSQTISQCANSFASVIGAIGAIAGSTKGTFLILMLPLIYFYIIIQKYFRGTNTEVARLESLARSPIYADFSQALTGMNSVRAYNDQQRFVDSLEHSVNQNSVANVMQQLSTNWLAVRLDFIGSLISLFIAVVAASTDGFIPAGYVGLGLSYSFQLTAYLKFLVRSLATGEAQMNAVERIMHFMTEVSQEGGPYENPDLSVLPPDWPSKGAIEATGVEMRYRDGPLVLKGLDFKVQGNEKVGVAGRTGSGKSSLMIGLFRIQELAAGKITIDGIDIATVPLAHLRTKLGIIPQDPVMFSASVRFNLDPFNKYGDAEIWEVLASINLKDHVLSLPNKLSEEVAEGGDNFSAGQRQLICIARAILRKPKILVLDEATASIDNETDALVQRMVRSEFKNCTVLTIAHRLNTIIDSDKVMILDNGLLAEMAPPTTLLADKNSLFRALWDKHQKSHGDKGHDHKK